MKKHFIYIIIFVLLSMFYACSNYDSYSDDSSFRLNFSADTVLFDPVISTVPGPTMTLYVFNNNADGIRVSNIRLQKGTESLFRINVDGEYLANGSGDDFLIRKNDYTVVLADKKIIT